ncbi:unnamed protein product [Somion occarium]|uniref:BHLH domain-containing protein n=1 Tax=Somion occarium TaxID=3059160 RepID=A0ABP1EA93_9APHY
MSSILSPSESLAFNGFLSSVDVGDVLEWSGLNSANLAEHLQPPRGKEALAKATKDLMSLEAPELSFGANNAGNIHNPAKEGVSASTSISTMGAPVTSVQRSTATAPNYWPGFGSDPPASSQRQYTYGFGAHSHDYRPSSSSPTSSSRVQDPWSSSHFPAPLPHSQSDSSLRHHRPSSPSPFVLPPIPDHAPYSYQQPSHNNTRPPSISLQSAPAVIPPFSNSKRSHPQDHDADLTSTKRRRPSTADVEMKPPPIVTLAPSTSNASSSPPSSTATPTSEHAGPQSRQSLLSPSQKRANHIQSEQKRRANIRRGYEALCEAVPALREAIKLEESGSLNGLESSSSKSAPSKRKKKGKGAAEAAAVEEVQDKAGLDGRAGPRSENVVLQKTIDHLNALLNERTELLQRLQYARNLLPSNHPALVVSPEHLDSQTGVPLWDREWGGGTGLGADGDGDD